MATLRGTTRDGREFKKRVSARTKRLFLRNHEENLATLDLEGLGDGPRIDALEVGTLGPLETIDTAGLAGHPGLEDLCLYSRAALDLEPLTTCPALRSVTLHVEAAAQDFTALERLVTLERLTIRVDGTLPHRLPSFEAMPGLRDFTMVGVDHGQAFVDALPPAITRTRLARNARWLTGKPAPMPLGGKLSDAVTIDSLDGYARCSELRDLGLVLREPVDLSPLTECRSLTSLTLTIDGAKPIDLSGLAGHPALESLTVVGEDQAALDLAPLATLGSLKDVHVRGGEWRELDLSPLAEHSLRSLGVVCGYLRDIDLEPIASPSLERLTLSDLQLAQPKLWVLKRCVGLRSLDLEHNPFEHADLSEAAALPSLAELKVTDTKNLYVSESVEVRAPGVKRWLPYITRE